MYCYFVTKRYKESHLDLEHVREVKICLDVTWYLFEFPGFILHLLDRNMVKWLIIYLIFQL